MLPPVELLQNKLYPRFYMQNIVPPRLYIKKEEISSLIFPFFALTVSHRIVIFPFNVNRLPKKSFLFHLSLLILFRSVDTNRFHSLSCCYIIPPERNISIVFLFRDTRQSSLVCKEISCSFIFFWIVESGSELSVVSRESHDTVDNKKSGRTKTYAT